MHKRLLTQIMKQIVCLCMVLIVLAPILLTLFAALKTKGDMATTSPLLLPALNKITFENFKDVITDKYLILGFKNTGIILLISLFFNVMFGTITAFIIERFEFKGKNIVVALFFMGMLIPTFVTEIARFQII
ncbi:multiple sugar transport system permease [Lachnospiraceae bacterium 10-1]|nr:multiple sugar transport system permease [Lachnospiraceae bacterium 10-1]